MSAVQVGFEGVRLPVPERIAGGFQPGLRTAGVTEFGYTDPLERRRGVVGPLSVGGASLDLLPRRRHSPEEPAHGAIGQGPVEGHTVQVQALVGGVAAAQPPALLAKPPATTAWREVLLLDVVPGPTASVRVVYPASGRVPLAPVVHSSPSGPMCIAARPGGRVAEV